jgi:hypothetical protein
VVVLKSKQLWALEISYRVDGDADSACVVRRNAAVSVLKVAGLAAPVVIPSGPRTPANLHLCCAECFRVGAINGRLGSVTPVLAWKR